MTVSAGARRSDGLRAAIVLGGGLCGSAARTLAAMALPFDPLGWPTATLFVNLAGTLVLGAFLGRSRHGRSAHDFWAIGVLGSMTTFSAFSVETASMVDAGRAGEAVWYVVCSIVGGLAAYAAGRALGAWRR